MTMPQSTDEKIAEVMENLATLRDDLMDEMPTASLWIENARDELRRARFHEKENYHRWKGADAILDRLEIEEWHPADGDRRCQDCGRPNPVWFADNTVWNALVSREAILCPTCFMLAADERMGRPVWRVVTEARGIEPA